MNNFIQNYEIILDNLSKIGAKTASYNQIRKPKLSNLEIIAMNLTAEYMSIDSECQLFRLIQGTYLEGKIERSVYNRRRRKLFSFLEDVRKNLSMSFNKFEDYFIVDSMPLEVCKNARAARSNICKDTENAFPDKGYCASQNMYYYGYKLHGVCSVDGVFHSIDITPASVHDIHYLKDIKQQLSDCVLLGDKGYLSAEIQLNLFESANIRLDTPKRANQKSSTPQPYILKRARKRIETLYSQLCDQFLIRRNYAKTFDGFKTRILSKVTAMTMIQFLNHFVFNKPLNNLKINLS